MTEAFWNLADRSAGPDGCWPWLGSLSGGRGRVWVNGRSVYAYRRAWELAHSQPFPMGLEARHACDNPICVNPTHIEPGTHAENMRDAKERGRARTTPRLGVAHHKVTISPEQIAATIDRYLAGGITQAEIAAELGVAQKTVSNWLLGRVRSDSGVTPTRIGKSRRPGVPLKPCGTHAAYARHRRAGEPPCEACVIAEREHCADQRKRRKSAVGAEHHEAVAS